jgi:hypothetical protein
MDLDFETFLNELNTADNNDNYNENFEEFLDRLYRMTNNPMLQEFNIIYNNNDDHDDETIYDDFDDLLEMIDDGSEQDAESPIEAE